MLSLQHIKDVQLAISKAPETTVNTPYTLASEFESIVVDQVLPVIPEPDLVDDSDQVGDGVEGPKDPRPGKTPASALTLSSKLNNRWNSMMMARLLGGTITDSLAATGVYDHTVVMQPRTSRVPKLTTVPMLLGGADPILNSMGVNSATIGQQGTDDPKASFELMGSGKYSRFRDVYRVQVITITGTPAGGSVIVDFSGQPVTIPYNSSAATLLGLLEALSNIAPGDVSVSGGALPGTPLVVTFLSTGAWANVDVPLMTVTTNNLTGGTSPTMTITSQTTFLTLPSAPSYVGRYMHPVALVATLNDGSAVDLNALGLVSHQIQITQNLEWMSLPGIDQFNVAGDKRSGTYMAQVSRGERQVRPQFDLYLDATLDETYWKRRNLSITSLTFKHQGELIARVASVNYYHEFELVVPLAKPQSLSIEAGGNWGVKRISLLPVWSSGFVTFRSRDSTATLT
jgi:hypothetical protein